MALGLVLVLVPHLVALTVEEFVGVASLRARAWLHLLLLGFFVALVAILALKDIAPAAADPVLIAVAALLGVAAAGCSGHGRRWSSSRS